jgi:hypothetical protein
MRCVALPSLAVVIVALAERAAAPPPKVSVVPSALVRVIWPWMPAASVAFVGQRDANDALREVGGERAAGADVAEGRRRRRAERHRGAAAEDHRLLAQHQRFEACLGGDRADVVEALAGVLRLEVDRRLDADALVGSGIVLRRDSQHAAAIGVRDAEAQVLRVDRGDGPPVGGQTALAGHARDRVAQRGEHRIDELRAELEIVEGEPGGLAHAFGEGRLRQHVERLLLRALEAGEDLVDVGGGHGRAPVRDVRGRPLSRWREKVAGAMARGRVGWLDEGERGGIAPHPTRLRRATFSRRREKGWLRRLRASRARPLCCSPSPEARTRWR